MWMLVAGAVLAETVAALLLRSSDGFRHRDKAALALCAFGGAFYLVSLALRGLPVSSVYPVWAGGGTACVAAIGMMFMGERAGLPKTLGVLLVVAGIVLLNIAAGAPGV